MRGLLPAFVLLAACGDDGGTATPDASVVTQVDADMPDAPPMSVVTFPPATLGDDEVSAKKWAAGSAPQLYMLALTPVLVADATLSIGEETCPVKTENGTTTTYTGGCTTSDGDPWTGTATQVGGPMGSLEYVNFGGRGTDTCNEVEYPSTFKYNGRVIPSTTQPGAAKVEIVAEITGPNENNNCVEHTGTFAIDYTVTIRQGTHDADGDGDPDDTYWSGIGRFGNSIDGAVDVMTTEEKIEDELCQDEALAGETKVMSGGHTLTITYDGATDCDPESTVLWAYDGAARGELTGVTCSTGGSSSGALVVLAAFAFVRRRRA